jgi:hypothetical protein
MHRAACVLVSVPDAVKKLAASCSVQAVCSGVSVADCLSTGQAASTGSCHMSGVCLQTLCWFSCTMRKLLFMFLACSDHHAGSL